MQNFVTIVNRGTYTNQRKALKYIARGLASVVSCSDNGQITEIHMLEAAELAMSRSYNKRCHPRTEIDPVTGAFSWMVADSGGSKLMKQYEGISGGTRVLQASHGDK